MPDRIRAACRDDTGFTLIELLIVIVVMSALGAIVVIGVAEFRRDSRNSACAADMKIVMQAANAYHVQRGTFPATLGELEAAGYVKNPPPGVSYTFDSATKQVVQGPCKL